MMCGTRGNKESRGTFSVALEFTLHAITTCQNRVLSYYCIERGNRLVYVLAARTTRTAKRDLPDVTRDRCGVELGEPFSSCSQVVVWKVRPPGRERSPKCGTIPEERRGEERTKHGAGLHWNNGDHKTLALLSLSETPGSRESSKRKAQAHAQEI